MKRCINVFLSVFLLSCCVFSCKSKPEVKKENQNSIIFQSKQMTNEIYNEDKSLLLTLKFLSDGNLPTTFNYKVVNEKNKEVIKEGVFVGSKIEWKDKTSLIGFIHKGIIQKEEALSDQKNSNSKDYIIIEIKKETI